MDVLPPPGAALAATSYVHGYVTIQHDRPRMYPHAAWADLRHSRPTDSGVVGGVPPGARRGAARAERRRGVELYRWLPGLLGVFNL